MKQNIVIKRAFTLAETLITLAIIGVVAAITIPSLMQSTQDAELKTAWKNFYSEMNNATTQLVGDNGGSLKGLCSNGNHDCLRDLYKPYLKSIKTCDGGANYGICWHSSGAFWALDGSTPVTDSYTMMSGLVLNKGPLISFFYGSINCDNTSQTILRCGYFYADVNGLKGPNKYGKDIFAAHVIENGLKPYGTQQDTISKSCEGTVGVMSGLGCSAKYLRE